MTLLSDVLRAMADGLDVAAGRDPVDEHAAQAADVINGHDSGAIRVGRGRAFWDWGPEMAQLPPAAKVRHLEDMLSAALLDRDKVAEEAKVLAAENRALRRQVDDPDEVVVTADAGDESTVIRLGVAEQELRRFKRMYGRASETIGKLRGERARHQEMFDRTMKGIDRATDALHRDMRAAADREKALQAKLDEKNRVVPADVQDVVDNARAYADIWTGGHEKFIVEPRSRDLVNAVRALDGQPPLPEPETSTGASG